MEADRIEKPDDYGAFGVRYDWLVDPDYRSSEVWELGSDGRYVRAATGISGTVDEVPGCEGLVVDLDARWAEVERLEAIRRLVKGPVQTRIILRTHDAGSSAGDLAREDGCSTRFRC